MDNLAVGGHGAQCDILHMFYNHGTDGEGVGMANLSNSFARIGT